MRKLSAWGFYRPRLAIRLMVLIKITMILLAWHIARLLQLSSVYFSVDVFYIMVAFVLSGILLYPDSRKKKIYFEYGYYVRQKLCDGIIALFSFGGFIVLFNTNLLLEPAYGVEMIVAITVGVLLGITVAGLACSLACNGNEVLAVLVVIFGAGGIIAGLMAWIKSIRKRKRKIMTTPENTEI